MQAQFPQIPHKIKKAIGDQEMSEIHLGKSRSRVFKVSISDHKKLFLKVNHISSHFSFKHEIGILQWLQGKLVVPEVVEYVNTGEQEYVVLTEVLGITCLEAKAKLEPSRIVALLAEGLREVHQIDISGCPFDETLATKLVHAQYNFENGLVDESDFDEDRVEKTGKAVMESLYKLRPTSEDHVFTHGDYCLPNVMVNENRISGYIDLGRAGVSDRYNDLAIASRSIRHNLGESYELLFFKEYGVNPIDIDKITYYRLMDEMF